MKKKDFYFELPEELIAQTPLEKRDESRLLILDKVTGSKVHGKFSDIADYFEAGDCLVLNDTKVIPGRIFGTRDTGARVEFLLLERLSDRRWEALVKPGKKAKVGARFTFGDNLFTGEIVDILEEGIRVIEFTFEGEFELLIEKIGQMPLPPYITEKLEDNDRYQTVFAKKYGSSAAPTAGLHFTDDLFIALKEKGVSVAYVTLHVGLGTFRPVKTDDILDHVMHSEYYELDEKNAEIIRNAKRVITVGTTSTRTLEAIATKHGRVAADTDHTDIFIYPGYEFKVVDALITNFHLPESTLIMLVSALAGRLNTLSAYEEAVSERYRFFSFGDAMFIK